MMKFNQLLARIVFVFPIFLEILPAKAFNLVYKYPPSSPHYAYQVDYTTPVGNKGKVWIDQLQKISPPSSKLLQSFKNQFSSYNFEASYTPVYGDFLVNSYQACPPAPNPGFCPDSGLSVGGLLDLEYVPKKSFDPQLGREVNEFPNPLTGQVRWVQWVTDNHNKNGNHGEQEATIDEDLNTPFFYGWSQEYSNRIDP